MQIKPDEITSILKSRIEGLEDGGADLSEVGTVLSVADGISRVHGLDNVMSSELLELPHDVTGLALNLESDNVGAVLFGEWDKIEEGDRGKAHRTPAHGSSRRRAARPHRRPARPSARRQGRHRDGRDAAGGVQGSRRGLSPAGEGAAPDRHQADRRDDERRPRPARADHRRPPDRQDVDLHRHDHQQQGQGREVRLRRDWAAHVHRRGGRAAARRPRRARQHGDRRGACGRGRADQVHGSVRRRGDRGALAL